MPKDPIAAIITRQIHLNRFSNGVSNRLLTILNNAYLDAIKQLNEIQLGTSGTSASSYQAQRLRAFLVQTRQSIISAGQQGEIILIQSLQGVAEEQVKFIEKQLAIAIEGGTIDGRKISPIASPDSIPSNVVINSVEVDPNYAKAIATRDPNDIPLILQRDKAQALAQATADAPVTLNLRTPLGTELARTLDNVPLVKRFRAITEASADLFDNQVRIGLMQNETTDQIVKRLVGKIQYEGDRTFLGKGALLEAKNSQVRSLVRTSVQSVANAASQAVYQSNQHVTKKYKYVATLDSRTTAFCQAHDGKIFEYGDGPVPPVHFGCLTEDSFVSPIGKVAATFKRGYEGFVYRITTASNKSLTCTPNHPVLTLDGWVAAQFLEKGGNVIRYVGSQSVGLSEGQDQEVKTTIKDFVSTFGKSSGVFTSEMPTSAPDFHGDGVDGEVTVISANRSLWYQINPAIAHHFFKQFFEVTTPPISLFLIGLSGLGSRFFTGRTTPYSLVSLPYETLSFFKGSPSHPGKLLLGSISQMNSSVFQKAADYIGRDSHEIPNSPCPNSFAVKSFNFVPIESGFTSFQPVDPALFATSSFTNSPEFKNDIDRRFSYPKSRFNFIPRHSATVTRNNLFDIEPTAQTSVGLLGLIPDSDSVKCQNFSDSHGIDPDHFSYLAETIPVGIEADYIVSVERVKYSGHVYNLETESGMYCSDSIITHNCRSTTVAQIDYEGLGISPPSVGTRVSVDVPVAADMDYGQWLKQQPVGKVEDILGKGKASLFLGGKVKLSDLVRADTREISLRELKEKFG